MHISINGCKLFFDTYGSKLAIKSKIVVEKPSLIVLHGAHGMVDHSLYVEFWSQFSDMAQVILIDQRGCGRSDQRQFNEWNLKQWAQDLYDFCQTLAITKPIIAGISMGGHVMCEYINRFPEHAGGLIFCNTEARFILEDVCNELAKRGGEKIAEIARLQFTHPTPEIAEQYKKLCIPYYAKNAYSSIELARCIKNQAVFDHYCRNEMLSFNYLDALAKIQCPTLLMVGEESPFHVLARAEEMAKSIAPQWVKLKIFTEAGAPVYKDKPEEAYSVVKNFLDYKSKIS